jgi:EKC/KEOPS complex subunit CGI121/TPRKB
MLSSHYKFFPAELSHLHIALFTNVQNAAQLRARLIKAATMEGEEGEKEREAVNFAFVDALPVSLSFVSCLVSLKLTGTIVQIASLLHLQTGIQQATLASTDGSMRTKTVHSEILWALNSSNNVSTFIRPKNRNVTYRRGIRSANQSNASVCLIRPNPCLQSEYADPSSQSTLSSSR